MNVVDNIKREIFVDELNSGKKCAEVFVSEMNMFVLICDICQCKFETMPLFGFHWRESHSQKVSPENAELAALTPIDCGNSSDRIVESDEVKISANCSVNEISSDHIEVSTTKYSPSHRKCSKTQASTNFCEQCSKQFKSRAAFLYHIKKHDMIPIDLKCKYCDKVCTDKSEYIQHKNSHSGQKKYLCPHCPKRFASAFTRQEHVYIHTGERPHKCPHCPSGFTSKYTLQNHIRMHSNQKEHSCEFCDKRYVRKSDLITHLRSHTGERPYQCEECGKSYTVISKLKEHIKRHSNRRDFKCDICGKEFFSKYILQQHAVKHSDERPFKCKICGSTFPRSKALVLHLKLHSEVKEYVCNICGKAFAQSAGLYGHKKSHGEHLASNKEKSGL